MKILMFAAAAVILSAGAALAQPTLDADGDGKVSLAEFRTQRTGLIMTCDKDGDGKVLPAELAGVLKGRKDVALATPEDGAQVFALLDTDKDGALTRPELEALVEKRFRMLDSNHDGFLDDAERKAWRVRS